MESTIINWYIKNNALYGDIQVSKNVYTFVCLNIKESSGDKVLTSDGRKFKLLSENMDSYFAKKQ